MAAKKIEIIYDINGQAIDVALEKSLNLQQSVKALTAELRRTKEGTAEFTVLSNKLNDTKDNLDRVNAKSKEFFGTLSILPGPVGQFAGSVDNAISTLKTFTGFSVKDISNQFKGLIGDIGGIISNIGKATGITKIYTTVNDFLAASFIKVGVAEGVAATGARAFAAALTATGVGALVVGLGYLISKLMEVGDEADVTAIKVARLNTEFAKLDKDAKLLGEQRIAQMKAEGATESQLYTERKKLKEDEVNRARDAFKQYQGQMTAAEIMDQKGTEGYKQALKNRQDAEQKLKQAKSDLIVMGYNEEERLRKENETKDKAIKDKQISNSKAAQEKIIQDTKTYYDKLRSVGNENEILKSKSSYERAYLKIVQDAKAEEEEIKKLKLKDERINGVVITGEQKRLKLINAVRTNANYKIEQLEYDTNKKITDDTIKQKEAEIELQNLIIEKKIAMIKDESRRQEETLKNDAENEKIKVNESIASTERKAQAIKAIEDKLAFDIEKLKDDTKKKESQTNLERIDNELKFLQVRQEAIQKGTIQYYDSQRDILFKSFERELAEIDDKLLNEKIKQEDADKEKLALKEKYSELRKNIDRQEFETYVGYLNQGLSAVQNVMSQQAAIVNAEKQLELDDLQLQLREEQKALAQNTKNKEEYNKENAKVEEAYASYQDKIKEKYFYKNRDAQYAQAMINAFQAAISAYSSLAAIPVVGPALGAAAAAVALAFGIKQANLIKAQKYVATAPISNSNESSSAPENMGQNYGEGGMIEGPRHAGGGVMINAEGGEAVMTRGAVTMFAPLLSAMNQMGGGTSFSKGAMGQANNDNPKTTNVITQPQIVKTYVVSSELTTEAQKQARLKDLSTL
jgi:hypothetical protein